MALYLVEGKHRLQGKIKMHGAKNSALPILAAALMSGQNVIHNCPQLTDVEAARNILHYLGCSTTRENDSIIIDYKGSGDFHIPDRLMSEMRSSIVFLGAVVSRFGRAVVSMPGGCELGPRPIDMHLASLRRLGVDIREEHGQLDCRIRDRLRGAKITLPFPSVGATENIMLAACMADGVTEIHNPAREPEIVDLANYLRCCGAKIEIAPDATVYIEGVDKLNGCEYSVIPDRIATATYLCCAAITGGEIILTDTRPDHLAAVMPVFEEAGCTLQISDGQIRLKAPERLNRIKTVRTMPYPGFSTDAQSPVMSMATVANGTSVFIENIFESRYKQVDELAKMGAKIKVEGRVAVVEGVPRLQSAPMRCTDLRGGASLVVSALAAEGTSEISEIKHISRGYDSFEENLTALGAKIVRK